MRCDAMHRETENAGLAVGFVYRLRKMDGGLETDRQTDRQTDRPTSKQKSSG